MTIDYNFDLAPGQKLGDTPGALYLKLRAEAHITDFSAKFPQPHQSDSYIFRGEGIQVTAQQIEIGGRVIVKGSIRVIDNLGGLEDTIKNAIRRFCLGSSVGMPPK